MKTSLTLLFVALVVGCGSSGKKSEPVKKANPTPAKKTSKPIIDKAVVQAFWKELPNIPVGQMKPLGVDAWPIVLLMNRKDMTNYSLSNRVSVAWIWSSKKGMEAVTRKGASQNDKVIGLSIVVAASLLSEYISDLKDPKTFTESDRRFERDSTKMRKSLRRYVPRHVFVDSWNALKVYTKQLGWPPPGELNL